MTNIITNKLTAAKKTIQSNDGNRINNKRLIFLVFSFFFLVNIVSSGGHFDWWDGTETFFVTESMVLKHSAKLHPDVPSVKKLNFDIRYSVYTYKTLQTGQFYDQSTMPLEPVYTVRSLLQSVIGVPFYYVAIIFSAPPLPVVAIFVNSLLISLTCVAIFCFSLELYESTKIAFVLSLIFGVCSFVWPYHTSFWSMPLQALLLIASAYFIYMSLPHHSKSNNKDNNKGIYFPALGGLFLGLSVFAHATSLILIPGFIAYSIFSMKRNRRRQLISFLIVLTIVLFFAGLVNYWRFGSFTEFGYGYFESLSAHNGWRGLIGLLTSPGAGLIFFFPLAILLPLAFRYMYRKNKGLFFLSAFVIIATWLDVGTLSFDFEPFAWSGAIAWGPRYLVPVLPFIVIVFGALLQQLERLRRRSSVQMLFLKTSIIILCVAGFYVNLVGTLVWYQYGIIYGWEREGLAKYPNNMDIMTWNPYYSPIILHTKALMTDFVSDIEPEKYRDTSWYWATYGLAPCSYDVYIFCKFGIVPIIFLSAVITVIAILIMMEISKFNPYLLIRSSLRNYAKIKRRNL